MKRELLMALGVLCVTTGVASACDSTQAYAHPTLFGSQEHTSVSVNSDVVVGGKIYKHCLAKTIAGKQNVVIGCNAKKMLADMKAKMDAKRGALYDPKMPVLRSELAVILAEGFELRNTEAVKKYTDDAITNNKDIANLSEEAAENIKNSAFTTTIR